MATHRAMDGRITVRADQDSGLVVLIVRDDTGREIEISLRKHDATEVADELIIAAGEL